MLYDNDDFSCNIEDPIKKQVKKAGKKILPDSSWQIYMHSLTKCNKIMETDQEYYLNSLKV